MLLFLPIMLCCGVLKFTHYAQYYALEKNCFQATMLFIQVCMKNSLHIADSFIKTVLLECIYKWYQCHYALIC